MAKQIKGNEVIEDNHLDNAIKQAEIYLGLQKNINEQIVKNAKALKVAQTAAGSANSAKGIKAQTQALSEAEKKKKAVLKTDKDIINAEIKLKALRSDKTQKLAELNLLNQQQAKINKQVAREKLGLVGAYEKESQKLIQLRKKLKDLIITEGEGSKSTKVLAAQVKQLDTKLKGADAAAGQFQRSVGNYKNGLKGAIGSVKRLAGAFGLFGGIQLAVRGIRNMFDVVKNFDQATADLASILGVTTDQMSELTNQAMELGAATIFTAAQVSELQKSFAKLGFTQEEIKGVTEATLELAAATGSDLGQSATVVGSTLKAFGLDVSETQRVVDVMAKSFSASSLDMEKFTTAMRSVAPVAKNAGFSIEETTALIGTITDAGVDASTAGTGLRNVFLELAKSGMTFDEAMSEINNSANKNATSLALFGKRGAVIGTVLAESGVSADALTEKLENAGGAAKEMADKQLNTLGGAVKLLTSAWEGFILKLNSSSGAGETLTKIIKFLAENLEAILNGIILITKAFGAYTITVKAAAAVNNLFGKSVIKNVKGAGLWAAALVLVVTAVISVVNRILDAKDANELFNETMDKSNELLEVEKDKLQLVGRELLNTKLASEERQKVLDKINAEYGTTLQNLDDEAAFLRQVAAAYKDVVAQLDKKIKLQVVEEDLLAATKKARELQREIDDIGILDIAEQSLSTVIGDNLFQQLETQEGLIEKFRAELISLQNTGKDVVDGRGGMGELNDRFSKTSESVDKTTKSVKKLNKALEDQSAIQEELNFQLRQQRNSDEINQQIENNKTLADAEKARLAEVKRLNDQQEKDDKKRLDDEKKRRAEALKAQKEFAQKTLDLVKKISDARAAQLDKEIEAKKEEIEDSKTEVARLQTLAAAGNNEAAESLKAEKVKQAKEKIEIERLEKRKKNLLIAVTTLELANNLIQQGDGNGLTSASAKMGEFLNNLPTFFEGTGGTVADALGATGTRDGHMVRVHDNEHIIGSNDSSSLHAAGLKNNADIVGSALAYQNAAANNKALAANKIASFTDSNIVNELQDVKKAIKDIKIVQQHIDLSTGMETIVDGNKTTRNNHRPTSFRI